MSAPSLLMGSAVFTRHDAHTRKLLADFKARLDDYSDAAVIEAAAALDRPNARRHPLCPAFRKVVDAELASRGLSLATLAEVTR